MSSKKMNTRIMYESSNSDEEMPILSLKKQLKNNHGINPNSFLCQPTSRLTCEFCPLKFDNQLHYLVHNAKHIIIPVEKLDPQITSPTQNFNNCNIEDEDTILKANIDWLTPRTDTDIYNEHILSTFTEDCKVNLEMLPLQLNHHNDIAVNDNDDVLQSFLRDCEVDLGLKGIDMLIESHVPTEEYLDTDSKSNTELPNSVSGSDVEEVEYKITIEDMPLIPDTEEKSQTTPQKKRKYKIKDGSKSKGVRKRTKPPLNVDVVISNSKKSVQPVHFEELFEDSQKYECMFCHKQFDNRYQQIKHNAKHLRWKTNNVYNCMVCLKSKRAYQSPLCSACSRKYYNGHLQSQYYQCNACPKWFVDEEDLTVHQLDIHSHDKRERLKKLKENFDITQNVVEEKASEVQKDPTFRISVKTAEQINRSVECSNSVKANRDLLNTSLTAMSENNGTIEVIIAEKRRQIINLIGDESIKSFVLLCDVCLLLSRCKLNLVEKGSIENEDGVLKCYKCNLKPPALTVVRYTKKIQHKVQKIYTSKPSNSIVDKIQFQESYSKKRRYMALQSKKKTNEERLKSIQFRLKFMKKL